MLTSLKIQKYRGISTLTLPHLSRINIFIGKNGTHKTSVLECAALASSLSPKYHLAFGKWRDMTDGQEIIRSAFHDLNTFQPIYISFNRNLDEYSLKIAATKGILEWDERESHGLDDGNIDSNISGVTHTYADMLQPHKEGQIAIISGKLHGNHIHMDANDMPVQPSGCFYIPTRRSSSTKETAILLTSLMESSQDYAQFLETLQKFDARIQRIFVGYRVDQPTILVDIGRDKALPINVLGDGFCRLVLMLTGLLGSNASTLIIDEIDSGLHYSVMESIWSNLLTLMTQMNKQLFCVTHNEEMLRATLEPFADTPEELAVYRLSNHDSNELRAQYYDHELLRDSFALDFEVR